MGATVIRTGADAAGGFTLRTEVCIVGSGAGGGVAAAVLAERGFEVVVLEEGPYVPAARMTQREEEMYPLLYRDGGNQATTDGGVSVLQGRTVGGSTVVNMADVVGISGEVLAHWREQFGVTRYGDEQITVAEHACRKIIGANKIAWSALNRNNERLASGAEKLGFNTDTLEHNRTNCLGSGYCLIGCAYDAKRSVALTFLPMAIATGRAIVQAEARVDRFEHDGKRVTAAIGHVRPFGTWQGGAPFRVEADQFVLSAGAIHSPVLLQASGLGGPAVGRHLSLQPQAPVAALFDDEVLLWRGIPQAAFVNAETASAADGLGGYRLEGVGAPPGMSAVTTALPAADLHRFMQQYRSVAANLCLVPDRPVGSVRLGKHGRPAIRYSLTEEVERRLRQAIETAARCWFEAGAKAVALPFPGVGMVATVDELSILETVRVRTASTPLLSAHPQGTCRMGPDPATSAVGLDLVLHGVDNLRVLDASIFPTSASSHTQLPVMAFARLAAEEIPRRG